MAPLLTLSALIHGESGVGKSWLLTTMPGPRVIFDIEGRTKFTPTKKVLWDPQRQDPMKDLEVTDETTVIVKVKDISVLDTAIQWLYSGQHPFRSAGVDSLTEAQKRLVDSIAGVEAMKDYDWGTLLRKGEKLVRDLRDMTDHPTHPLDCVVMVTGTQEKGGYKRPKMQGQIALDVPYYVDVNGLYQSVLHPETGQPVRALQIQPNGGAVVVKDGTDLLTQRYGAYIYEPNFAEILSVINEGGE